MNKTRKFRNLGVVVLILLTQLSCVSQAGRVIDLDSDQWVFNGSNFELTTYKGVKAMHVKEGGFIFAYLKDSDFMDGTIEFKMAVDPSRNFPGVNFRIQDPDNFENFYIRPHQSGNPDATQYTPVFNGLAAWQLYHGEHFTKAAEFTYNEWMAIKLVVKNDQAEVYIDNSETPVLFIPKLQRELKSGMVGFTGEKGYYADLSYTNDPNVQLKGTFDGDLETHDAGTITEWWVSKSVFNEDEQLASESVPNALGAEKAWTSFKVDGRGRLNLSRAHVLDDTKNVVFVKHRIESEGETTRAFTFGYNDRVKIFLNGKAVYAGNNTFRSRDYRFLGSIGYFDTVYLPLQKGSNELIIRVAESFGGWGIMGKLSD